MILRNLEHCQGAGMAPAAQLSTIQRSVELFLSCGGEGVGVRMRESVSMY